MNQKRFSNRNASFEKSKLDSISFENVLLNKVVDHDKQVFNYLAPKLDTSYLSRIEASIYLEILKNGGFSFLHLNVWSLEQHFEYFKNMLHEIDFMFKIICFTKTWPGNDNVASSLDSVGNYANINQVQNVQQCASIYIFVHNSLFFKKRDGLSLNCPDIKSLP